MNKMFVVKKLSFINTAKLAVILPPIKFKTNYNKNSFFKENIKKKQWLSKKLTFLTGNQIKEHFLV